MLLSRIAPRGALLFSLILTAGTGAGCAVTAAPADTTTTTTSALSSETFTLSSDVEPDLSGRCDVHAVLTLSSADGTDAKNPLPARGILRSHLYEEAVGACRIHVDKTPRDYVLLFDREDCGSLVYTATATVDGTDRDITLTDNRKRTCTDGVPARIVVEEREDSGDLRTFYSRDGGSTNAS
jgi:hypothetical protein